MNYSIHSIVLEMEILTRKSDNLQGDLSSLHNFFALTRQEHLLI